MRDYNILVAQVRRSKRCRTREDAQTMPPKNRQPPDLIAHILVTNVGEPVRVYLEGGVATIPVEPYRGDSKVQTETVPVAAFDAVIRDAAIVDGGLNLFGADGLQLPPSEWRRIGLQKHWDDQDVNLESRTPSPHRRLEIWANREEGPQEMDSPETPSFNHLDDVPENSPVIRSWREEVPRDYPDKPPVPLSRPTLYLEAVVAAGVMDPQGLNRVEVGGIASIEVLDTLDEWPSASNVE